MNIPSFCKAIIIPATSLPCVSHFEQKLSFCHFKALFKALPPSTSIQISRIYTELPDLKE